MNQSVAPADSHAIEPRLAWMAVCTTVLYGAISLLSWRFEFDSPPVDRPILLVFLLFAVCFAIYGFAIHSAARQKASRELVTFIFLTAILFRLVLLVSLPIQEVDIYRYLWDGRVSCEGVSPFRFRPLEVKDLAEPTVVDLAKDPQAAGSLARSTTRTLGFDASLVAGSNFAVDASPDLQTLASLVNSSPTHAELLERVHFPELPTVYPLVSQVVFAAVTYVTPSDSRLLTRLIMMKACFVVFDLATLALVMLLLNRCGKHVGLSLIYAWCPLLMKEVANSGHLDAIAVFLTTAAVYLLVRRRPSRTQNGWPLVSHTLAFFMLALAVGAKLYPVILAPLFAITILRSIGWRGTVIPLIAFVATTAVCLSPWIPSPWIHRGDASNESSTGVVMFLRQWEINDFLFLNAIENLRPNAGRAASDLPWFTIVPESMKQHVVDSIAMHLSDADRAPFFIARLITMLIFAIIALSVVWRCNRLSNGLNDGQKLCEAVFLTIAWFWLLCPTQNPWYWTWTLPFLAFTRNRLWLVVSGLVFLYYLRFWLGYHFAETNVLGTQYQGTRFFDYCVTWIEFAPWFAALFLCWLFGRVR